MGTSVNSQVFQIHAKGTPEKNIVVTSYSCTKGAIAQSPEIASVSLRSADATKPQYTITELEFVRSFKSTEISTLKSTTTLQDYDCKRSGKSDSAAQHVEKPGCQSRPIMPVKF